MSENRDIEILLRDVDFTKGSSHKERLRKMLDMRKEKRLMGSEENRLPDAMLDMVSGGEGQTEQIPDDINGVPVSKDGSCPHCGCGQTDEYLGGTADCRFAEYTCYDCGKPFWKKVR